MEPIEETWERAMPNGLISRNPIDDDAADAASLRYTCTECGCLCDDLELDVSGGRVVDARSACVISRPRLIGLSTTASAPTSPQIRGREASREEALSEAARILGGSMAALMVGFRRSTNEGVRVATALADRIGATIEVGDAAVSWPRIAAMQRVGSIGSSLGEVKNRADVIVFWGADPVASHPRHWGRYSAEATGRFVPEGRAGRRVVVFDEGATATAARADVFLRVRPEAELNVLLVLRALARDVPVDAPRVEASTGCSLADLQGVAELLQGARYGAWFSGAFAGRGPVAEAGARHQAVTGLIRELNRKTRFVALGLGEAGNAHGAESVLAWQSGFTPGVDFGAGHPVSLPGESSAVGRLARGEFDAAILVGGSSFDALSEGTRARLAAKPWIFVGDRGHEAFGPATIAFPATTPGIDESGTYTRVDGVSLPIRGLRPASTFSEGEWLAALCEAVDQAWADPDASTREAGE